MWLSQFTNVIGCVGFFKITKQIKMLINRNSNEIQTISIHVTSVNKWLKENYFIVLTIQPLSHATLLITYHNENKRTN